ncbi:MAG: Vmc-like lipoprotein signal peptide domain-containing protein, partial [Lachnospiraceae bacterium]
RKRCKVAILGSIASISASCRNLLILIHSSKNNYASPISHCHA